LIATSRSSLESQPGGPRPCRRGQQRLHLIRTKPRRRTAKRGSDRLLSRLEESRTMTTIYRLRQGYGGQPPRENRRAPSAGLPAVARSECEVRLRQGSGGQPSRGSRAKAGDPNARQLEPHRHTSARTRTAAPSRLSVGASLAHRGWSHSSL
jgi:hypothetical protein